MTVVPSFPAPQGPNAARARFYAELVASIEFMALYYVLTLDEQREVHELVQSLAARAAQRAVKG
jgi:hypothetical protein